MHTLKVTAGAQETQTLNCITLRTDIFSLPELTAHFAPAEQGIGPGSQEVEGMVLSQGQNLQ